MGGALMPTTKTTARTAATRGITLTFDPRYLEWVVQFWLARDLAPAKLDDFTSGAITHAKEQLAELNTMGLREEEASTDAVAKAIRLLQDLGLLQKKKVPSHPPKLPRSKRGSSQSPTETFVSSSVEAPYYELAVTADGRVMLTQPVAMGGLRLELVRRLVTRSHDLTALLAAIDYRGATNVSNCR